MRTTRAIPTTMATAARLRSIADQSAPVVIKDCETVVESRTGRKREGESDLCGRDGEREGRGLAVTEGLQARPDQHEPADGLVRDARREREDQVGDPGPVPEREDALPVPPRADDDPGRDDLGEVVREGGLRDSGPP